MKVQIQIPRGWRRVTRGKVQRGDMLTVIFHGPGATAGSWHRTDIGGHLSWCKAVGDPVANFHCVIRRVADARRRKA